MHTLCVNCLDAMVGLERTLYTVSENVGVVEVCAVVFSPDISCPIGFPFIVNIFTSPDTAGKLVRFSN